jgi:hypothetical protein
LASSPNVTFGCVKSIDVACEAIVLDSQNDNQQSDVTEDAGTNRTTAGDGGQHPPASTTWRQNGSKVHPMGVSDIVKQP